MSKKSTEEEPFQKIRLTFSEVAIEKLAVLRTQGYFRSDSATVEECIRGMYDIVEDFYAMLLKAKTKDKKLTNDEKLALLLRIGVAIRRFMPEIK